MAKFVATEFDIELGGTDLTEHVTSVEIAAEVATEDGTTFASEGWEEKVPGMKSGSASLEVLTDYAVLDGILWGFLGTAQTLKVRPKAAAVSATNPSYECSVIVTSHTIGAGVGDLASQSPSLEVTGKVLRKTS